MTEALTAREITEFTQYLNNCTDRQVIGVYEKERDAGRDAYEALAWAEIHRRGLSL